MLYCLVVLFLFPGFFSGERGLEHADNCTICTAGSYCRTPGLDAPTGPCWGGYYCREGALLPNPENDRLASVNWPHQLFSFEYLNDACPPGHYCMNGTKVPEPCPPGFYHNTGRISSKAECLPCQIGKYCPNITISGGVAPDCSAGYVCTGGSSKPEPDNPNMGYLCPAGFYCPVGE